MQNRYQVAMAALLSLALNHGALTQDSSKQIATRIELYKIQKLTLSDQQFLKGAVTGKSALPFYTDCLPTYVSNTDVADHPIRIYDGTPDRYKPISVCKANESLLFVAAKRGRTAMTSADEITVVLGPEHDQRLRRVVLEVIVRLGGKLSKRDWGLGGSQEIETVEIKIGTDRLVLEAETYVGLSLHGPSRLVHRIEAMVKAEMAKH